MVKIADECWSAMDAGALCRWTSSATLEEILNRHEKYWAILRSMVHRLSSERTQDWQSVVQPLDLIAYISCRYLCARYVHGS